MFIILLLVIVLFFILAGFFSGMETGLISIDQLKLKQDSSKDKSKKEILNFLQSPDKILGTTLIGTNISVVIVSSLTTFLLKQHNIKIDDHLFSLIVAALLLIFSEIIPKALYRDKSYKMVNNNFKFLKFFYMLLKPLVSLIEKLKITLGKLLKMEIEQTKYYLSQDDLSYMLSHAENDKDFVEDQKDMLEGALEFANKKVENVMTHRTEIVAIPEDISIDEIIATAKEHGFSRFPVYKNDLDHITGILIIYDLLKKKNATSLKAKNLMREAYYAPETMSATTLLTHMQTQKKSMAIILDSYGGTAGLITIEDLLEEFVGEIEDEFDTTPKDIEKISSHTYLIKGFVEIDFLNDKLELELPEGDYETIAGLLINTLGRIPSIGTLITLGNYKIKIEKADQRRIKEVRLIILDQKK